MMRFGQFNFDFFKKRQLLPFKLTIYNKMMLGFCIIIALMVASSTYILMELDSVSDSAKISLSSHVSSIDLAKQLKTILFDEESHANKYLISKDKFYIELFRESSAKFSQKLMRLRNIQNDEQTRSFIANSESTHNWLVSRLNQNIPAFGSEELTKLQQEWRDSSILLHGSLDHIIGMNQLAIGNSMAQVDTVASRSARVALFLIIFTMLLALFIASIISRTITRPISNLIKGTKNIAEGKFDPVNVSTDDEVNQLAESFNNMSQKLKEINEIKADMMHQISHELRTPLQAIMSASDILDDPRFGELNEDQKRMLSMVKSSTATILSYTNQYLDIAKVDAGMMVFNTQKIKLPQIINMAIGDLQPIADKKGIHIEFSIGNGNPPELIADGEKIRVAMRNLIGNALKFSPQDATIEIDLEFDGNEIKIDVKDTGIGIDPEALPHVFDKFYQAKNTTTSGGRGTGLGLAITKAFIEGHGGNISVSSIFNQGSIFSITLPVTFHRPNSNIPLLNNKPGWAYD